MRDGYINGRIDKEQALKKLCEGYGMSGGVSFSRGGGDPSPESRVSRPDPGSQIIGDVCSRTYIEMCKYLLIVRTCKEIFQQEQHTKPKQTEV